MIFLNGLKHITGIALISRWRRLTIDIIHVSQYGAVPIPQLQAYYFNKSWQWTKVSNVAALLLAILAKQTVAITNLLETLRKLLEMSSPNGNDIHRLHTGEIEIGVTDALQRWFDAERFCLMILIAEQTYYALCPPTKACLAAEAGLWAQASSRLTRMYGGSYWGLLLCLPRHSSCCDFYTSHYQWHGKRTWRFYFWWHTSYWSGLWIWYRLCYYHMCTSFRRVSLTLSIWTMGRLYHDWF